MSAGIRVAHADYVGARALFDPKFIPPSLINRGRELAEISSVLIDGIQDMCPVSILITGMEGIGKTSLARKALSLVKQQLRSTPVHGFFINCKDRSIEEILFAAINSVESPEGNDSYVNYFEFSLPQLWSYFRSLLVRRGIPTDIWIFDNIDDLDIQFLLKFVQLGKELGFSTISNHDTPMKNSAMLPKSVDIHQNLEQMTPLGLYKVTKQRIRLAFPFSVDAEVPRAISDFVDNFDSCRPGACIRVLKDVYPVIQRETSLSPDVLRAACQRQILGAESDDFQILNDVLENELLAQLFIDNLASYFQGGRLYISEVALREEYAMAAESIGIPFTCPEFENTVIALIRINILRESRISRKQQRREYLLVPPPALLTGAIDAIFTSPPLVKNGSWPKSQEFSN